MNLRERRSAEGRLIQGREQAFIASGVALAGACVALLVLLGPAQSRWFAVLSALVSLMMFRSSRSGIWVSGEFIEVRNPLERRRRLPWSEVASFSLGRWGPLPRMAFVETKDGERLHVWGLEAPNPGLRPGATDVSEKIEALNRELKERTSWLEASRGR